MYRYRYGVNEQGNCTVVGERGRSVVKDKRWYFRSKSILIDTSLDFEPLSICLVNEATSFIFCATLSERRAFVSWFQLLDPPVILSQVALQFVYFYDNRKLRNGLSRRNCTTQICILHLVTVILRLLLEREVIENVRRMFRYKIKVQNSKFPLEDLK